MIWVMAAELIHGDRRADRRYESAMELRFHWMDGKKRTLTGRGVTVDLSSAAVRFESVTPPPDGATVELHIDWPFLLQNTCPLDLVVIGRAINRGGRETVVAMTSYEFRTRGERSFVESAAPLEHLSIVA